MKVTKKKNGYTIRLSDSEMELLQAMVERAESVPGRLWDMLNSGERRSYSRRCGPMGQGLPLLRVDTDRRGEEE